MMQAVTARASRSDLDYLVMYSTNSWLAYEIGERFYKHLHFVWCTRCFDVRKVPDLRRFIPPSSNPWEIYRQFFEDAQRSDRHSAKIQQNRVSLHHGADMKFKAGVITAKQHGQIHAAVNAAKPSDFKPLLYVIPFAPVEGMVRDVPVSKRAGPLSIEHRIPRLPRELFDPLEIELG